MRSKPASEKSLETGSVPEPDAPDAPEADAPGEPDEAGAPGEPSAHGEPVTPDGADRLQGPALTGATPVVAAAAPEEAAPADPSSKATELPAAKVHRDKPRPKAGAGATGEVVAEAKQPEAKQPGSKKPEARKAGDITIEFEVSRQRSIAWTTIGGVIGGLLIWKLGTVAVWGGIVLVAFAAYHAWNLAQTLLYAPGTIVVSDREVSLPRGLCMSRPVRVARKDITAAYFLRRSVPWNHAAPVLIIELGTKAMAFPRDWFASEADQRRVIHALLRDKARSGATTGSAPAAS
jgi:hypothetical protein